MPHGKLNISVIGCGASAALMGDTIRAVKQVRPYAAASRDLERALTFGRQNGFKCAYGSYTEMVEDKGTELVYVATPNSLHYEHIRLCLEHGRAVLCESPFTMTTAQAEELFDLAQQKGVFLAEAARIRFLPLVQTTRDVLTLGRIGEPRLIRVSLSRPADGHAVFTDGGIGGGALSSYGVHALHFISALFGDEVVDIQAHAVYDDKKTDQCAAFILTYDNGRMAVVSASLTSRGTDSVVIEGSQGYALIDDLSDMRSLRLYDAYGKRTAVYRRPRQKTGLEFELQAVARAMKEGATELAEVPRSATISILNMLDFIRRRSAGEV